MDLSKLISNPTVSQAQTDLTRYGTTSQTPSQHYAAAVNSLGIPDARAKVETNRQSIADTESLINAVDPSVTGRTQGSLVTEAQRQALIGKERAPHYDALSEFNKAYGVSSGNLADLMGQAQTQATMGYQDYQSQYQALLERLNTAKWLAEQDRLSKAGSGGSGDDAMWNALLQALGGGNTAAGGGGNDDAAYQAWVAQQIAPTAIKRGTTVISPGSTTYKAPSSALGTSYNTGGLSLSSLGLDSGGLSTTRKSGYQPVTIKAGKRPGSGFKTG